MSKVTIFIELFPKMSGKGIRVSSDSLEYPVEIKLINWGNQVVVHDARVRQQLENLTSETFDLPVEDLT